jgi:hypothetical protein
VRLSVVVFVPLTQLFELAFKVPIVQELVLNNCRRGVLSRLLPMLLNAIVGEVLFATNEYQTSGDVVFPQNAEIDAVAVAPYKVPEVLLQVGLEVRLIALPQASLAGAGSVIQILKFHVLPVFVIAVVVNTLTR